jgi:DNA topoisomerase I
VSRHPRTASGLGVYALLGEANSKAQKKLNAKVAPWLDREYPYVAPPDTEYTLRELAYLSSLVPLREEMLPFIQVADEDFYELFWGLGAQLGVPLSEVQKEGIVDRLKEVAVLVGKLKWLYNRPRPYQVAERFGFGFQPLGSKTAHSPAYPSGHAIQAYWLAAELSSISPQHRRSFMDLADAVSFTRLVAGYHWPSDLMYGKDVFRHFSNPAMPAAIRVAAKYQNKKEVPKADGSGTTTVYEYGPRQIQNRNREKAERIESLRKHMSDLRKRARRDLEAEDPKVRLTALAVCLIDETYERVGNETSAENGHFGVTNWLREHVTLSPKSATLRYVGKSGVKQEKRIEDSKVLSALRKALKGKKKGDKILCEGDDCTVLAKDVNAYLKPYGITAKDIRGLHANEETRAALKAVRAKGPELPRSLKEREPILKKELSEALDIAAAAVGHEPSTLKNQYLVPGLVDAYLKDGTVLDRLDKKATLSQAEREDREAERLVKPSPKNKPPRRDLERRRVNTEEEDPDVKADKKERSNRDRDASAHRVALRHLLSKGNLVSVRDRSTGRVVQVTEQTLKERGSEYESVDQAEPSSRQKEEGSESASFEEMTRSLPGPISQRARKVFEGLPDEKARKKFLAEFDAGVRSLAKGPPEDLEAFLDETKSSPAKSGEDFAKALYYEKVFTSPFEDFSLEPLPSAGKTYQGSDLEAAKKRGLDRAERSLKKYRALGTRERQAHLDALEKELGRLSDFPDEDGRKIELEGIRRGLIMAGAVEEGDDAKGIGPAMASLARAAIASGNPRDVLAIGGIGGTGPIEGTDQDAVRSAYRKLTPQQIQEVLGEGHPIADYLKLLTDPEEGKYVSPADYGKIKEEAIDYLVAETAFLDPALLKTMGGSPTVGEARARAKELRKQRLKKPPPPGAPLQKVKGWFSEMAQAILGGGESSKRPGTHGTSEGSYWAKSPDGVLKSWPQGEEGSLDKAKAWASGKE